MKFPVFPLKRVWGLCLVSLALFVGFYFVAGANRPRTPYVGNIDDGAELRVLTYSGWVAPHSIGSWVIPEFEKKWKCRIKIQKAGDSVEMVNQFLLSRKRPKSPHAIHLMVGVDRASLERLNPWMITRYSAETFLPSKTFTVAVGTPGFIPFDYGHLALIADNERLKELGLQAPQSLKDLELPIWKRQLLIQDPRVSAPGSLFLLYTANVYGMSGNGFDSAWKNLRHQWLTLSPSWPFAYQLFLKKEAPLVWSYVTSQAYHSSQNPGQKRYQAILFDEGQPIQVEGAVVVQDAPLVRPFLEFLLSKEVQERIPETQWMLPVRKDVTIPPSFQDLPQVKKGVDLNLESQTRDSILRRWSHAVNSL